MRLLLYLLLVLVVGCAISMDVLYDELERCLKGGYLCAELQEEIDVREHAKDRREVRRAGPQCPSGKIAVCDNRRSLRCVCVYPSELDRILNRW